MKERVIYLRTSTEEQNPENQLNDCLTLVEGEYTVLQEKQSAFKDVDRPIFNAIKEDIKKGRIKELICWDWDRLFRNRKKLTAFFEYCKIYKCKIHSFRQKFFEDFYNIPAPFDEIIQNLVLNLMGWLAEDESNKKSMRIKAAVEKNKLGKSVARVSGKKWGRPSISKKVELLVKELYNKGLSYDKIIEEVHYWDKNGNKKRLSKAKISHIINGRKA